MCKKETAAAKNAGETKLNNDVELGKAIAILHEYRDLRNAGYGHEGAIEDIATADRPTPLDMTYSQINSFVLEVVYGIDIERCRKDRKYYNKCLEKCK